MLARLLPILFLVGALLLLLAVAVAGRRIVTAFRTERQPVRIGVLAATSGPQAEFDRATIAGVHAEVDRINRRGGVLHGRPLELVVADTAGDPQRAAREAVRLTRDVGVAAIIGGTTPELRRAATAALMDVGGLLVSPTAAEGLDDASSLITVGSLPNQRIVPAASWAVRNIGPRAFLLADEGLLASVAHAILADHIPAIDGVLVGEAWMERGEGAAHAAAAVHAADPDVIVVGLGPESIEAFLRAIEALSPGYRPRLVLWGLRRAQLDDLPDGLLEGDFLVGSTFGADSGIDEMFAEAYAARSGGRQVDSRAVVAANAAELVARGIDRSGGSDPAGVRAAMLGSPLAGQDGLLMVNQRSQTAWKTMLIGRIEGRQVEEVWSSGTPLRPRPWPNWRSRREWRAFVADHLTGGPEGSGE